MRSFSVQIPQYEGPLDLLMSIVRRNELSIDDLPLAPIAAQYLAYIKDTEALDVNLDMEWIDMAARLIHWKSSSLLSTDPTLPDPGVSLAHELSVELKNFSDVELSTAKGFLTVREQEQEQLWTRSNKEGLRDSLLVEEEPFASLWTIRRKAQALQAMFTKHRLSGEPVVDMTEESTSVDMMLEWARAELRDIEIGLPVSAESWFAMMTSLGDRICLFLALLELARNAEVELRQHIDEGLLSIVPLAGTCRC